MWPTPLSGPVEMPAPPGQPPELQPGPPMVPDASFRRLPELGGAALGLGGESSQGDPPRKGRGACLGMRGVHARQRGGRLPAVSARGLEGRPRAEAQGRAHLE